MDWENLGSIHSPRPTSQNSSFESMDELGKAMPLLKLHFKIE